MTLEEMIAKVKAGNQDPAFSGDDIILPYINQALGMVAKRFCIDALSATASLAIPVGTSDPVSMPDDYSHDLFRVENTTHNFEVSIRSNQNVLRHLFDGMTQYGYGPITDVAVVDTKLHFKPSPVEEGYDQSLLLFYYSTIDEYEAGDSEESPEWIPEWLHQGLIVDYVLKELWGLSEDGIDGQRVNTAFYEARHNQALQEMQHFTRWTPKQRPIIKRTARFF